MQTSIPAIPSFFRYLKPNMTSKTSNTNPVPEAKESPMLSRILRAILNLRKIILIMLPVAAMSLVGEFAYSVTNISILPLFLRGHLQMTEETIGIVIVVFLATEALLKSYFGQLGDRIGRKPLMVVGPLLSAISALIIMHVHSMLSVMSLRILDGMGAAALWPAMFTLTAHKVSEKDRTTAMSILNFTYIAGVAIAFAAGRIIEDRYGVNAFYACSLLFALTGLVALILIKDVPKKFQQPSEQKPQKVSIQELLHGFLAAPMMGVIICVAFIGVGMLMGIATFYTKDVLKIAPQDMPKIFLPVAAFVAIISVPAGWVVDRWSKTRAIHLGLAFCALPMLGLGLTTSLPTVAICAILLGLGFVMVTPAWMALISSLSTPDRRGAIIGAMGTAQGVGALIGPFIGGWLYHHVSQQSPFLASGILLCISLILSLLVIHDHK